MGLEGAICVTERWSENVCRRGSVCRGIVVRAGDSVICVDSPLVRERRGCLVEATAWFEARVGC